MNFKCVLNDGAARGGIGGAQTILRRCEYEREVGFCVGDDGEEENDDAEGEPGEEGGDAGVLAAVVDGGVHSARARRWMEGDYAKGVNGWQILGTHVSDPKTPPYRR